MLSAIVLVSAHITTPPGQNSGKIEREDAVAEKVEANWANNVTMIDHDWVY